MGSCIGRWIACVAVIEVLFTRRHPNDSGESEWESRIRELEGQIDDIARDHGTPIHIVNHPKPAKPDTWPEQT